MSDDNIWDYEALDNVWDPWGTYGGWCQLHQQGLPCRVCSSYPTPPDVIRQEWPWGVVDTHIPLPANIDPWFFHTTCPCHKPPEVWDHRAFDDD